MAHEQYCLSGHGLELECINAHFQCQGCKEPGSATRYRCHTCNHDFHEECHNPSLTVHSHHFPAAAGQPFDLLREPPPCSPRFCDACGKRVLGFVYHCVDRGWDLHPCCNNLLPKIRFSDGLELFLHTVIAHHPHHAQKACFLCKKRALPRTGHYDKGVPGWSYKSACGRYRCHVSCVMEMIRSLEIGILPSRGSRGESGWDAASFASTAVTAVTEFLLGGDPTLFLVAVSLEMLIG